MSSDDEQHTHNYVRVTWNGSSQTSEGTDWDSNPTVIHWHVEYWEEKCECGDVQNQGSHTVVE